MNSVLQQIQHQLTSLQEDFARKHREEARSFYMSKGLDFRKNEVWRNVDFSSYLNADLQFPHFSQAKNPFYACNIPNLETLKITLENGFNYDEMKKEENGIIYGSIQQAAKLYPELVERYFNSAPQKQNSYLALNTALFADGIFIFVPDNTSVEVPIQIQSLISSPTPMILHNRNLIIVGKNSKVTFIHCDDSVNQNISFSNTVTELHIAENAHVEHYKMQNLNNQSGLLNHLYVNQEAFSELNTVSITFNGGQIRNHNEIQLLGSDCYTQAHGLYLLDKDQQCDNYIFLAHNHPRCVSQQLYKGIVDDTAKAVFNGHVLVAEGAVKTEAYQSNKNILMTDKAKVDTKPFLEIYNDDVKCSHGSTIGQLDELALFYIQSRGISPHTAKTMLLYAFCDEVLKKIQLEGLRERLSDMVKRRLHGELTVCSDCALNCSVPDYNFDIRLD